MSINGGSFQGDASSQADAQALGGSIAIEGGSLSLSGVTITNSEAGSGAVYRGGRHLRHRL